MRKLDYLRKIMKTVKEFDEIYFIKLPDAFKAKWDINIPSCLPYSDENGNTQGVAVEHAYEDEDGQVFTWCEYFMVHPSKDFVDWQSPYNKGTSH